MYVPCNILYVVLYIYIYIYDRVVLYTTEAWVNKKTGDINDFLIFLITICCVALFFICYKHRHLAWTILDSNSLWDTLHLHTLPFSPSLSLSLSFYWNYKKISNIANEMETSIASSAFCVLAWFPSPTSIAPPLSANYTITLPILSLTLRHYILISFVSQFRCQLYDTLMCHNTLDA